MANFTRDWDADLPSDSTVANQIDDYNNALRTDIEERLHELIYGFTAGETTDAPGFKKATFKQQGAAPGTPNADEIVLYAIDDGSECGLYAKDEDAHAVQLLMNSGSALELNGAILKAATVPVAALVNSAYIPVGAMLQWLTDTAPTGWLLCYGQAVSRVTYSALFTLLGTTFGSGDGSTTFNLPDLRGRLPLGQDDMGGSSADRVTSAQADSIGGADGAETHTLTTTEIPAHTHGIGGTSLVEDGGRDYRLVPSASSVGNTKSTGGGGAHNNMPPYTTVNYIIKW